MKILRRILWSLVATVMLLVCIGALYRGAPFSGHLPRASATVDGTRITYHQVGQGRDVVLIHGAFGSAEDFEPLINDLKNTHRLTIVDRPGFGGSSISFGDANLAGNARLISQLIVQLGLERPILVGHSYGGGVTLTIAQQSPELVSGIVLLASVAFPGELKRRVSDYALTPPYLGEGIAAVLGPLVGPNMIARIVGNLLGPDAERVPPEFVSWRIETWVRPRVLTTGSRQGAALRDELAQLSQGYRAMKVKAFVLHGDSDPLDGLGVVDSARLARELPGAQNVLLTNCGHYLQFHDPARVVEAIRSL